MKASRRRPGAMAAAPRIDDPRPFDELAAPPEQARIERHRHDRHAELAVECRRADLIGPLEPTGARVPSGKITIERPSAIAALAWRTSPRNAEAPSPRVDGDIAGARHRPADDGNEQQLTLQDDRGVGKQPRKAIVSHVDWCLQAMITGPGWQVLQSDHAMREPTGQLKPARQKSIQNSAQAITQRRGISRIGEPKSAMIVVPTYQPILKRASAARGSS